MGKRDLGSVVFGILLWLLNCGEAKSDDLALKEKGGVVRETNEDVVKEKEDDKKEDGKDYELSLVKLIGLKKIVREDTFDFNFDPRIFNSGGKVERGALRDGVIFNGRSFRRQYGWNDARSLRGNSFDEYESGFSPRLIDLLQAADYLARSNADEIPVIGSGIIVGATLIGEGRRTVEKLNRKVLGTSDRSIDLAKNRAVSFLRDNGLIGEGIRDYAQSMRTRTLLGLTNRDDGTSVSAGVFFEGYVKGNGNIRVGASYGTEGGAALVGFSWRIGPKRIR